MLIYFVNLAASNPIENPQLDPLAPTGCKACVLCLVFRRRWDLAPQRPSSPPERLPLDGKASEERVPRGELTVTNMLLLHPPAANRQSLPCPSPASPLPEPSASLPEVPTESF